MASSRSSRAPAARPTAASSRTCAARSSSSAPSTRRSTRSTSACRSTTSRRFRRSTAASSSVCSPDRRAEGLITAPIHELDTVRDWLRWAVTRFGEAKLAFGHGMPSAWDEAAYLVMHALSLPLDRLEAFLDAKLTQAERQRLGELLSRRIEQHVPAAYLTR